MILIADDDQFYVEDLKAVLQGEGFSDIVVATTGSEALSLVTEAAMPDAVVLDLMLPFDETDFAGGGPPRREEEPRGVQTARALKDKGLSLSKVVVITALYVREKTHEPLEKLGVPADQILIKPAPTLEILRAIRRACKH